MDLPSQSEYSKEILAYKKHINQSTQSTNTTVTVHHRYSLCQFLQSVNNSTNHSRSIWHRRKLYRRQLSTPFHHSNASSPCPIQFCTSAQQLRYLSNWRLEGDSERKGLRESSREGVERERESENLGFHNPMVFGAAVVSLFLGILGLSSLINYNPRFHQTWDMDCYIT